MQNNVENKIDEACNELARVLKEKNKKYGDSFSKTADEYGNAVLLLRIHDKLNRLKQLLILKDNCFDFKEAVTESVEDTFLDLAGYAVLSSIYIKNKNEQKQKRKGKNNEKTFKNLEEMKPYYNEKTNTYEFIENGCPIDIVIDFDLFIASHIYAKDIKACDIKACDIKARDISAKNISAWDIKAENIKAGNINASNIKARDIKACEDINASNIKARDISAEDIKAWNISAEDIKVWDIKACEDIIAENINANNILYSSVCYARQKFVCNSIKGAGRNSKHFCLDSEIVIKGDQKNVK